MNYIVQNFDHLIGNKQICLLSKEELALILKHKFLRVTQED
jgi:hypothetical protein